MIPIVPGTTTPVVTDRGTLAASFRTLLNILVGQYPMSGSGSPEGVVEAAVLSQYMDTAGTPGSILYIKRDADIGGNKALGWVLV